MQAVGRLLDAVETKRFLAMSPTGVEKDFELEASSPLSLLPTNDCNVSFFKMVEALGSL